MRSWSVLSRAMFVAALWGSAGLAHAEQQSANALSFTTFNMKWYGLNGRMEGILGNESRDASIRHHFQLNGLFSDVIAFQEVVDTDRLANNILGASYRCESYEHENTRHQHVVICVRSPLRFEKANGDDNFAMEEVAQGLHRPAVHGIVKNSSGKALAHVVAVHLKARPEFSNVRLDQSRVVADYLQDDEASLPVVVMGDFNSFDSDPQDIQAIFDNRGLGLTEIEVAERNTYRTPRYQGKLDRIWMRGMNIVDAPQAFGPCNAGRSATRQISTFNREVSDHCPVKFILSPR